MIQLFNAAISATKIDGNEFATAREQKRAGGGTKRGDRRAAACCENVSGNFR
jgi:hypothetical protein